LNNLRLTTRWLAAPAQPKAAATSTLLKGIAVFMFAAMCTFLASCTQQQVTPTPKLVSKATPNTPTQAVAQFHDVLQADMINVAVFSLDEIQYGTPAATVIRQNVAQLSKSMTTGGYDFTIVDHKIDQNTAVVLVQESPVKQQAPSYKSIFLIRRNDIWKIAPRIFKYDSILGLTRAQAKQFSGLEHWFHLKRADLKINPPKSLAPINTNNANNNANQPAKQPEN
jgi:hypothetical protein